MVILSKQYAKVNTVSNTIVKLYNREEFNKIIPQIYQHFDNYLGIHNLPFGKDKFKYIDKFINWYNQYYFLSDKYSYTLVWRDPDSHVIQKDLVTKIQQYAFAKILKRNKDNYMVSYITPEWIFNNYEDFRIMSVGNHSYFLDKEKSDIQALSAYKQQHFYKRPRYAGVRNKHHFERYYAELADDRYWKSIGAPLPRRMNGTLKTRNCWEDWEDEVVSTKGNWKHSTKCKHQWEPKQKRLAKRNNITDVSFLRTPEQYIDELLVDD